MLDEGMLRNLNTGFHGRDDEHPMDESICIRKSQRNSFLTPALTGSSIEGLKSSGILWESGNSTLSNLLP